MSRLLSPHLLALHRARALGLEPGANQLTPEPLWHSRRDWLAGAAAWSALPLAQAFSPAPTAKVAAAKPAATLAAKPSTVPGAMASDPPTPLADVTGYNNFYEFGFDKADPAAHAHTLKTRPWAVVVDGLVGRPRTFGIDELLKLAPLEERRLRLRCVEGWSMVIPWLGYSLSTLLRQVQPLGSARFVQFESFADAAQMPGVRARNLPFPYIEGLRLDEAMHPLATLTLGLYGQTLPNQNGAPVRVVLPWKYGFKSAKSLVRIRLVAAQPTSTWVKVAPEEYGFYANVNPQVPHPRWSQASERRIGAGGLLAPRLPTQLFNGYAAQVAGLYRGLDLKRNF